MVLYYNCQRGQTILFNINIIPLSLATQPTKGNTENFYKGEKIMNTDKINSTAIKIQLDSFARELKKYCPDKRFQDSLNKFLNSSQKAHRLIFRTTDSMDRPVWAIQLWSGNQKSISYIRWIEHEGRYVWVETPEGTIPSRCKSFLELFKKYSSQKDSDLLDYIRIEIITAFYVKNLVQ